MWGERVGGHHVVSSPSAFQEPAFPKGVLLEIPQATLRGANSPSSPRPKHWVNVNICGASARHWLLLPAPRRARVPLSHFTPPPAPAGGPERLAAAVPPSQTLVLPFALALAPWHLTLPLASSVLSSSLLTSSLSCPPKFISPLGSFADNQNKQKPTSLFSCSFHLGKGCLQSWDSNPTRERETPRVSGRARDHGSPPLSCWNPPFSGSYILPTGACMDSRQTERVSSGL